MRHIGGLVGRLCWKCLACGRVSGYVSGIRTFFFACTRHPVLSRGIYPDKIPCPSPMGMLNKIYEHSRTRCLCMHEYVSYTYKKCVGRACLSFFLCNCDSCPYLFHLWQLVSINTHLAGPQNTQTSVQTTLTPSRGVLPKRSVIGIPNYKLREREYKDTDIYLLHRRP